MFFFFIRSAFNILVILSPKCFVALGHLRAFLIYKVVIVCVDVFDAGYHIISASCKL